MLQETTNLMLTLHQKSLANQALRSLGPVWIGSDIPILGKSIVQPQDMGLETSILLHKSHLPPIEINRGSLGILQWSVRSFIAQSGLEPLFHEDQVTDEMIKLLRTGETVPVPLRIANYGVRAVEIEGNFMRFFYVDFSEHLSGENLRNAIGTDFKIEGSEGIDWHIGESIPGAKDAICVILPLTGKTYYIPPLEEPVCIKSRAELSTVLTEVPEELSLGFKIGETSKVQLSENLFAVILTTGYDGSGRHIRSPLIDAGFQGRIRTETCDGLDFIELFLYRK